MQKGGAGGREEQVDKGEVMHASLVLQNIPPFLSVLSVSFLASSYFVVVVVWVVMRWRWQWLLLLLLVAMMVG